MKKNEYKIEKREMKIDKNEQKMTQDKESVSIAQEETTVKKESIIDEDEAAEVAPTEELTAEEILANKLEEAEEELAVKEDKYLRLSAEFDNYRKRSIKEKANLILNGGEKSFTAILPILDDLERALETMEHSEDTAAIKEGVQLIYTKFITILNQNGIKPIDTDKLALDTDVHEAIAMVPTPDEELKGKIIDCVQRGYKLNDKVIRHAKVVVGQ